MNKVRYRYCIDCGKASAITTRIERCSECWERPDSVEVLEGGTVVETWGDCQAITPSEAFGADIYKQHPDFWIRKSQVIADVLEEAAIKLEMLKTDNLYYILSLNFLSEITNGKIAGKKLATRAKAELQTETFNWLRAIHDGKMVDFELRGFAALMELHRPNFMTKTREKKAA
ncbi:hypothetical protein OIU34_21600 [Pararhizobium sp. BT-229]|uniref:hypothetical protein n=1 Tax=Pararhizobium sp. BT-229 TaxID=2986923 RepID=UPI0021F73996|nr:hypothetical protein [Pararhizobium sp. BT-229]MCV9964489.1 hypothetical protein [Pararhizobium sp. BT-229]